MPAVPFKWVLEPTRLFAMIFEHTNTAIVSSSSKASCLHASAEIQPSIIAGMLTMFLVPRQGSCYSIVSRQARNSPSQSSLQTESRVREGPLTYTQLVSQRLEVAVVAPYWHALAKIITGSKTHLKRTIGSHTTHLAASGDHFKLLVDERTVTNIWQACSQKFE